MKQWIQVCDKSHDKCSRPKSPEKTQMPTRLIQVKETLRLVDSTSIPPFPYVALSHCWGPLKEDQKFCTYTDNIDQFKTSIEFDRMPSTFRDAVTVTRGLGIDYLWIDSLCIIQDDTQDWATESRRMEQVFSTAHCTLGVSSAKSSLEGFLHNRSLRPCVQLSTKDSDIMYVCEAIDDFYSDVDLGELNSRGWVLQERALSRRTIYYTSTQAYWECGAGVQCETLSRLKK